MAKIAIILIIVMAISLIASGIAIMANPHFKLHFGVRRVDLIYNYGDKK